MLEKKRIFHFFTMLFTWSLLGFIFFGIGKTYSADYVSPGSNEDPLITKSYLDERLKNAKAEGGFKKISLRKKEVLELETGSELIIYKGNAVVKGEAGLLNVSKGILFRERDSMVKYNVFLAPSEKCGIIASDGMIVFVSGGYKIKK